MKAQAVITLLLVLYLGGCQSPEATRSRAGGAGADRGNRGETVRMHEGSKPYYETPRLIPTQHPSLEPAEHAYRTETADR